ncbi:MAG TPA: TSUP family transporter [Ramlibacter sp.]|nr:TSUP family transporter [Ramlibacter sp.]
MSGWQFAGFLLCVTVASCAQGITGFALALILLGLSGLFELAPLTDVANVATVLSLSSAAVSLPGARRFVQRDIVIPTVNGSVVGLAAGVVLLAWLQANVILVLRVLLGLVIVACAVIVLVRTETLPQRSSRRSFQAFGVLSGLLGGLFAASGPPLVYQFYRQPLSLNAVRDTLVASLAAGSLVRLVMVVGSGQFSLRALWMALASVPLAMGITWWMRRHPPAWRRETVLKIVCALLVVTGVGLIAPAFAVLFG